MSIDSTQKKSKPFFKFDKVLTTLFFIVFPGIILDGLVEYNEAGFSIFFYRALFTFTVSLLGLFAHKIGLIKKCTLLVVSVYTIVLCMMASLVWGFQDPTFHFEPFFLKLQVILALLLFAVGMLVHFRHIVILLSFNFMFIMVSMMLYPEFPLAKFAFYGVIISGGGLMAFFCQRILVILSRRIKEANRLISIKNEELKEMNQSKDDLFRIIGHDLRTPFYQLSALIDMVDEAETEKEKTEIKVMIKESADKGNQLLGDLLQWGNSYKKQSEVLLETKEIAVIVEKVFEFSDIKRQRKEISLINKLPKDLKISINPAMMETVMRNLITNAIKFSHRGSDVVVRAENVGEHVVIAIEDKGIGMCDHSVGNLFTKEKNISTQGTENEEGTGFGLSIAKKLVEKQNGIFEIESASNEGTTISLYFPLEMSA